MGGDPTALPFVSIVIPCRNESAHIGACLDSILQGDYPLDRLEALVVDGMSDDGTREILASYGERFSSVRVIDNPKRITPAAFNAGIRASRGDFILIMSSHATYAPDAVAKCVGYHETHDAENVGGILKVRLSKTGFEDHAVAAALSHVFGVGGARHRTQVPKEPVWADTAAFGCYRRSVFEEVGLFNEQLVRGQDMELNLRMKAAGGRTLLAPDVVIYYYPRSDFAYLVRHSYRNGLWAILPFEHSRVMPIGLRHLVPMAFVLSLLATGGFALVYRPALVLLIGILVTYLVAALSAGVDIARRRRDVRFAFVMPVVFFALHASYGLGSVVGVLVLAWRRLVRGRPHLDPIARLEPQTVSER